MMYVSTTSRRGMGDALQTGETAASIAAIGAQTTTAILGSLSPTLTLLGLSLPVVGAAIAALVTVGIVVANMFRGCGQTCVAATNYANQADAIMRQNVDAYTSSPVRYASMQAAALNNFDTTWAALQKACGQPALQAAGQRCITDRQRGACTWKASPGGWNADGTYKKWGAAGSGTDCWNWFIGMRDPIANDPFVQPDPVATDAGSQVGSGSESLSQTVSGIPTPLLVAGGLAIAAFALGGD